jgi:thiol-disulfide isomerase/thioredoxin
MRKLTPILILLIANWLTPMAAEQMPAGKVKLEGTIVCCEECWTMADRQTVTYGTASDQVKASECIAKGDPTVLAVMEQGKTRFYDLIVGRYKRDGTNWLAYIGRQVRATGMVGAKKNRRFIKVDELQTLKEAPKGQQSSFLGKTADLSLKDLFGVEQRLSALRGRIVILNFWATHCAPCREEMPDLVSIQNRYAALGVQVVGASADTLVDQQKVLEFVKETKINFPIWLGATTADMAPFGLGPALPGTAIIDREGRIVWTTGRMTNEAELNRELQKLLNEAQKQARQQIQNVKRARNRSAVPS